MFSIRTGLIVTIMMAAFTFLQFRLWFEDGGIRDMMKLKKMLAVQSVEMDELKKRNDDLLFQVQRIQNGHEAAEARARSELGMVKKGETFYQVVK